MLVVASLRVTDSILRHYRLVDSLMDTESTRERQIMLNWEKVTDW